MRAALVAIALIPMPATGSPQPPNAASASAAARLPEEQYLAEVHRGDSGRVVVAHDLDVY